MHICVTFGVQTVTFCKLIISNIGITRRNIRVSRIITCANELELVLVHVNWVGVCDIKRCLCARVCVRVHVHLLVYHIVATEKDTCFSSFYVTKSCQVVSQFTKACIFV